MFAVVGAFGALALSVARPGTGRTA
jgi:hypothetical protein